MPEGYTLYDAAKGNVPGSSGRPGSALPRRDQPGAQRRPQSAGVKSAGKGGSGGGNMHGAIAKQNTKNAGRAAAMKAYYGDSAEGDHLGLMSKEALMLEVNELKKKNKLLEKQSGQMKAENQRLENEIKQQQQRIDRLMDPAAAARSGVSASGTRKEVEKSLLVRHLKQQMMQLRATIAEKDSELESAMRSAKMSNITELITEREEYYFECRRLKGLVKNLRGELAVAKRAKKGNSEAVEMELRREVARLAAGYQDILGTIRDKELTHNTAPKDNVSNDSIAPPRQAFAGDNMAPDSRNDDLESPGGPVSPSKGSTGRPQLDIVGVPSPGRAGTQKDPPSNSPKRELPFKIGDRVEGRFQGQGSWYPATVKYITGPTTLHLAYDDGDEEPSASLDNIRPLAKTDSSPSRPATTAIAAVVQKIEPEPEFEGEAFEEEEEGVSSKYTVGEAVEALYYNGSTWYPAKIGAAHSLAGQWHYDLNYDDGDREMKVHESKIKLKAASAPAPAPAPVKVIEKATKKKVEEGEKYGSGPGLDALLGLSPEKGLAEHQKERQERKQPKDYSNPSALALDLRSRTKFILCNYKEYRKAFASMSGCMDGSLQHHTSATMEEFKPFAEDVMEKVLSSSGLADLYDEVAQGSPSLSFSAFVFFMAGVSSEDLHEREVAEDALRQEQAMSEQRAMEEAEKDKERQDKEKADTEEAAARQKQEQEERARQETRAREQERALERARRDEEERRLRDEQEREEAAAREAALLQKRLEDEERRAAELKRKVQEQERQAAEEEERQRKEREAAAAAEAEVVDDDASDDFLNNLLAEPSEVSADDEVADEASKPSGGDYEGDFEEATPRYNDDFE